ncbi:MAG: hypothetical protein AAB268_13815, partial [Elusimicrobiota bacterium]
LFISFLILTQGEKRRCRTKQRHFIPSLILSWVVDLVRIKGAKWRVDEAPVRLLDIFLRWGERKVRIPPFNERRD